ncbi:MAG TPA: hypothetical protein EYP35_11440 [Desulfobacterales bacterium]|nr:hypothetical protein [Desulfobacterales bacterium]HIP39000.1 hypothetical protein [Desulfocapsa sulfexigens]
MKHHLALPFNTVFFAFFLLFFVCSTGACQAVDYKEMSKTELQNKIATLGLGLDLYIVGKKLTAAQLETAKQDNAYKAYPGTVKFKDGDIFVIADNESNVVIAVYKRNKKAGQNDFKIMISELMLEYGEPTAEAHGKTIYWNYGEDGLITEELYRTVKSQGQLDKLTILATVKFSSSESVQTMTDMIEKMDKKKNGEEVKKNAVTSDNYVMIQSDLLTQKYLKK